MDSSTLTLLAAWATVAVALLVVWLQNRATKRLTSIQLFIQLAAQYDSEDMQRARARLAAKLLSDPTTVEINDSLLVFYENIAILDRRKLLDSGLMRNTFSIDVRNYWLALRHYVEHVRNTLGDSVGGTVFYLEFEQLNDRFVKEAQSPENSAQSSLPEASLTTDAVQKFLHLEVLRGDERTQPNNAMQPTANSAAFMRETPF